MSVRTRGYGWGLSVAAAGIGVLALIASAVAGAVPAIATSQTQTLGPNLVPNPSFETIGSDGLPSGWKKGGYGTNTRTLSLATSTHSGSYAASASISSYTSGDAKWYFSPVAVAGGTTYQFSDWYVANVSTEVDAQVTHQDGSVTYIVLGKPSASSSYAPFTATFTLPADASSVTIFHVVNRIGELTVDDYALQKVTAAATTGNLIPNGDFETAGSNGLPLDWIHGGYGSNTRTFTYPAPGQSGNGATVTVSNYVSGDAKWASETVPLSPGTYQYSDSYKADVPSILTAEFKRADGSYFYSDLETLPAASSWTSASAQVTLPADAVGMRVFHLIKQDGTLSIDNVSLIDAPSTGSSVFDTGAVSFRFDDGLEDQYANAAPLLDQAGFKATFYIVSQETFNDGYSGYMSIAQVQDLAARGHEIGAHTQTHPHLTTLTPQQQQQEIAGSRQDILGWGVGPVLSFDYPYGEYDSTTIQIVQNAGFTNAVSTVDGFVSPSSDRYQLEYGEVNQDTSLAQVESWVDTAKQSHLWLILSLHDISTTPISGYSYYSTTPSELAAIIDYIKQSGLPVVTVSDGARSL